ncbi:MAG: CotH kinase family protein [Clostridiaceae bacterium]|nr:CotH kinase family protein [Eubacteriales bacterium]
MLKHRFINFICIAVVVAALIFTVLFSYTPLFGIEAAQSKLQYADKLFDDSVVHALDISVDTDDWAGLIESAGDKEYVMCNVTIDGERFSSAAVRAKGNTSLSSVSGMGGERYSFKVEFDHYEDGLTYYGLDKLSLNNLIFDKTYLKDYLVYDMMDYMGVDAPLASFVLMTVNGEPWGLYLAVEGVEEAFAERNYGHDYGGELYKPDSMSMGADGEGNDLDNAGNGGFRMEMPDAGDLPEGFSFPGGSEFSGSGDAAQGDTATPGAEASSGETNPRGGFNGNAGGFQNGGFGRASSGDVALVYTDDLISSYANIFGGAIFDDVTDADKHRLISSLKDLNAGENLEKVLDVEEVLKYFVVHNFSLNFDSYTGSLMHNYYLYEENGRLSMIPWDYNLAFGSFNMGGMGGAATTDSATSLVNYPIDTPTSGAAIEDRPMLAALLNNEEYLALYHEYFDEFLSGYFESGHFEELMERVVALIDPYVREDATAFYTYDEFTAGAEALKEICLLRAQSVRGQLDGTIPATSEGQSADSSALVDASGISTTDLGSMTGMMGGMRGENQNGLTRPESAQGEDDTQGQQGGFTPPDGAQMPNFGQNGSGRGQWNGAPQSGGASGTALWWLFGSGALLLGGLVFAALYKRRKG